MRDEDRILIVGPPGTGKTRTLEGHSEEEIARGVKPQEILAITFTRAARQEFLGRLKHRFGFSSKDLPWVRTIHSTCYLLLGGREVLGGRIVDGKKLAEFEKLTGYAFSEREEINPEDYEIPEAMLATLGDWYLHFHDWWRNLCYRDPESALRDFERTHDLPPEWSNKEALRFIERYEAWKNREGLYDFTDLLVEVWQRKLCPEGIRVFFHDEAMDVSPLQFRVARMWEEQAERSYYAFDPDQSIYGFQGADPSLVLGLKGKIEFLSQSKRVPRKPRDLALKIIKHNKIRYHADWEPASEGGFVEFDAEKHDLPFEEWVKAGKRVFVLHRTRWLASRFADFLSELGIPFGSLRRRESPLEKGSREAVRIMHKLCAGEGVPLPELVKVIEKYIPSKPYMDHGAKSALPVLAEKEPDLIVDKDRAKLRKLGFTEAFMSRLNEEDFWEVLKIPDEEKEYFRNCVKKYGWEILEDEPKILNGTIHSAKGRECDIVVINPNITKRPYEALFSDPEPERRVWYVAATRCREGIVLLQPESTRYFEPGW